MPKGPRYSLILAATMVLMLAGAPALAAKRIALTFDDVPRVAGGFMSPDTRTRRLIAALRKAKVSQAAFFVTVGNLDKPDGAGGEARIAAYVRAGHVIANHSFSHSSLNAMSAADYLADLDKAGLWLKGRPGLRPWFRFPFLHEGKGEKRDAVRSGLRARGLVSGYVTINTPDWFIDQMTRDAVQARKPIDRRALGQLYVETLVRIADEYDAVARKALGRQPDQVMLLHETDINALFIGDLVAALRRDGWDIIPIDTAYHDPIAAIDPDTDYLGDGRVAALARVAGWQADRLPQESSQQAALTRLFQHRVLHEKVATQ